MIGLNLQKRGIELDAHMPISQVISRAHEIKRAAVRLAVRNTQHRLRLGHYAHERAVCCDQYVPAAHHFAAFQEHTECAARRIGAFKAALLARVPVELERGGAL
jgi:hypothetical protein